MEQALEDNPADPTARSWSLLYHRFNGDSDHARQQAQQLIHQLPLYWPARLDHGELLRERGDTAAAIGEQERVLEQDPQNVAGLAALARTFIDAREVRRARETLEQARKEDRQNYILRQQWALLLAVEGKTAEATREMDAGLQAYAGMQIFGPASAAEFYAVIGAAETALEWLERAVQMGDDREEYLRRSPLLSTLRAHRRFQQILESVAYRRKQRASG